MAKHELAKAKHMSYLVIPGEPNLATKKKTRP
jgi:hypothetical protein